MASHRDLVRIDLAALWLALLVTSAALLVLGDHFTKLTLVGPLTAYDLTLLLLATLSLGIRRSIVTNRSFLLFAIVVGCYGLQSLAVHGASFNLLRQLAMFLYAAIGALIVSRFIDGGGENSLLAALRILAAASVVLQLVVGAVDLLQGEPFGDEQYHYLSPASIVLNLVALAWVLASRHGSLIVLGLPLIFLCLYMSGHSSAVLAGIVQLFVFGMRPLPRLMQRAVVLGSFLVIPVAIWLLVSSNSVALGGNAMWRFFFWVSVTKQIFVDKLGLLGHGFGVPYASADVQDLLQVAQGYTTTLGTGNESFESTPHNFFITVAFHVGFLPAMILYVATWRAMIVLCFRRTLGGGSHGCDALALGLSLVGLAVWSSFNVIVELPHASLFFWLVFFLAVQRTDALLRGDNNVRSSWKSNAQAS